MKEYNDVFYRITSERIERLIKLTEANKEAIINLANEFIDSLDEISHAITLIEEKRK